MFSFFKQKHKETSEIKKSIYSYILENINSKGELPLDFTLPDDSSENEMKFAAGAMDGIGIYHMAGKDMSKVIEEFTPILESALLEPSIRTEQAIKDFLKENRVLRLIDPLSDKLKAGQTNIEPKNILETAYKWATESDDVELTKLGLALLGLLNIEKDDKYRKVILTLGKYDEYTLYSLVAVSGWEDGRKLAFDFAKTTHGWGKIHSVERLNPENQEEKEWILKYGCTNDVVNAYLGLTCAEKGDMISALKQEDLDSDTFSGIGIIIEALFDEGPVAGISAYDDAREAIGLYLKHAEKLCNSTTILSTVLLIKEHYEKKEEKEDAELCDKCHRIINWNGWKDLAIKEINDGDKIGFYSAWNVANKLDYDINEPLYRYIEKNTLENGYYISTLLKNPEYKDKIIKLYELALPLDNIASGMGDSMGFGKEYEPHRCLLSIIQALSPYPMTGIKFIQTGLASPVINNRNGACATLETWQSSLRQQVSEFSTEITEQIKKLIIIEVDEKLKERYIKLLNYNQETISNK